jgi:hypothetical protein
MPMLSTTRALCLGLIVILGLMLLQVDAVSAASCSALGLSSISGKIKTLSGAPVGGVVVKLMGPGGCTNQVKSSASTGGYVFLYLKRGTYTVTPTKSRCTFAPASTVVTLGDKTAAKANFTATCL